MSGKLYNKNLTFLQDQPFAERISAGFSYKKRRNKLSSIRDSSLPPHSVVGTPLFIVPRARNKSEKMKKAETSLIKHFCLLLERTESLYTCDSIQALECSSVFKVALAKQSFAQRGFANVTPHLLVSVDSMQNTLLVTRGSRSTERVKTFSHFKKTLQESRKIRLLYGNLSRRHLSRATAKIRLPGENLLLWLESRLDVALERCGFFGSIKAARHSVLNGKILVNSKRVRSPGFILEGGDLIKVVQERVPARLAKVSTQTFLALNKKLSRGVILSNEVFPRLLRNKNLATHLSKRLRKSDLVRDAKPISTPSIVYNKRVDKIFESSRSLPVLAFPPYNSIYTWFLKKEKNFQPREYLGRHSKALFSTELQFKLFTTKDTVDLHNKVSASNNWRFVGSPHLLFSFFSFDTSLQKVMTSLAQTYNKGVSVDKRIDNHKIYDIQEWNKKSTHTCKYTRCHPNSCTLTGSREYFNFSTNYSILKYSQAKPFIQGNESLQSEALQVSQDSKGKGLWIEISKIASFLDRIHQSLKNKNNGVLTIPKVNRGVTWQDSIVTNVNNFFGKGLVRVLTDFYNNLSTSLCFKSLDINESIEKREETLSQVLSILVKKDENTFLCVLFPDLLLYSLFIKREVLCSTLSSSELKKQQLESNNQVVSLPSPASLPSNKKQKASDFEVSPFFNFPVNTSRIITGNYRSSKVGYKKINTNQGFDFNQARRIKPLHLEVSYQSLCAVYLYSPQRVCLPIMIDVDCLAKA